MPLDFGDLHLDDESPIYLQIIRYIKFQIARGSVTSGDELPSRRLLSATLGVNPNTIQKAYKQIEQEGLMVSYAGSKSLVQFNEEMVASIRKELIQTQADHFIDALKQIGISKQEAHELIDHLWLTAEKGELEHETL